MNYTLIGSESYLRKRKLNQLKKEHDINDMNLITFDYTKDTMDHILEECNTMPFFSEHKMVVIQNCTFFGASNKDTVDELVHYLEAPNPTTIVVLDYDGKKDARKKVGKDLAKLTKEFRFEQISEEERNRMIREECQKRQITMDQGALREFQIRVGLDLNRLYTELDKLELHGGKITKEVIEALISRPIEDDTFLLSNAIFTHDTKKVFSLIQDFKQNNVEIIALIGLLAAQFRFLVQVQTLKNEGYSNDNIARELSTSPGRIWHTVKNVGQYRKEDLLTILKDLSILDQDIKTGRIDKQQGFEVFLLKHTM